MSRLLAFWDTIIAPLLDVHCPSVVFLDTLGDDGALPGRLLQAGGSFTLHVADPNPGFDPALLRAAHGDRLILHRVRGQVAMPLMPTPDLVLLDGDPNWFSTQAALEAARTQAVRLGRPFPLTLAGNAGWPYARRDAYADPAAIPAAYRFPHEQAGLKPASRDLCAGAGLFADHTHATAENEPRLGVLTAIEDFLLGFPGELAHRPIMTVLPGLFGLAVLVPPARQAALGPWLEAIAMGSASRALASKTERLRTELAVAEAELRGALARERIRNDRVTDAFRDAQAELVRLRRQRCEPAPVVPPPSPAPPPPPEPQPGLARRAVRRAIRTAYGIRARLSGGAPAPAEISADDTAHEALPAGEDIERVRNTPVFDAAWYLAANADVAAAKLEPAAHYVRSGAAEGRDPSLHFFSAWYLDAYPDVAEAGLNPLVHYLMAGAAEGRDPGPHFSTRRYRERYADVAEAGINPLEHWIACGRAEGRLG